MTLCFYFIYLIFTSLYFSLFFFTNQNLLPLLISLVSVPFEKQELELKLQEEED
jgi:hypothetical protein